MLDSALPHEVKIYVPSTRDVNTPLSPDQHQVWVDYTARRLSSLFGGATAFLGVGMWLDQDNQLIKERVGVIESSAAELGQSQIDSVILIAQHLALMLGQEAIAVKIDGQMIFVSA